MKKIESIHFQTTEYEHRDRGADWFWAVGIITVSLAVTSIILNNVLFAFVIVLAGFALSLFASKPPKIIDVVLDEQGVRVDKFFYPFRNLESFWVEDDETPRIQLKSQRLIMPFFTVHMNPDDVEVSKVRKHLSRYLPEVFHTESPLQRFMDYLGF